MTVTSSPSGSIDHCADLNETPTEPSPCIIDFFAGRDCLLAEIDQANKQYEIERPVRAAAQHKCSAELFDPLEDLRYSLISAAALVSLIVAILSMSEFRIPRTQPVDNSQSRTLNPSLVTQNAVMIVSGEPH